MRQKLHGQRPVRDGIIKPINQTGWQPVLPKTMQHSVVLTSCGGTSRHSVRDFRTPVRYSGKVFDMEDTFQIGGNKINCAYEYRGSDVTLGSSVLHAKHCAQAVHFDHYVLILEKMRAHKHGQ